MKNVGNHNSISRNLFLSLALLLTFSFSLLAQTPAPAAAPVAAAPAGAGDPVAGKALFNAQCAACHKLDAKMTGPALRNVAAKYDMEWLYKWINNSTAMIKSGDPKAVKIWEEYKPSVMTAFPQLSKADIDNIIAYTSAPAEVAVAAPTAVPGQADNSGGGDTNNLVLGALGFVMLLLIVLLFLVSNVLNKIAKNNGIEVPVKAKTMPIWQAYAKNQFLVIVTAIFLLLSSAYFVYGYLMQVDVNQNYAPIQPIHYSHKIHAGENGIDCKYCHSSARVSKHAGIPSLNVCMNCHKSIAEFQGSKDSTYVEYTKEFYTAEIQKL